MCVVCVCMCVCCACMLHRSSACIIAVHFNALHLLITLALSLSHTHRNTHGVVNVTSARVSTPLSPPSHGPNINGLHFHHLHVFYIILLSLSYRSHWRLIAFSWYIRCGYRKHALDVMMSCVLFVLLMCARVCVCVFVCQSIKHPGAHAYVVDAVARSTRDGRVLRVHHQSKLSAHRSEHMACNSDHYTWIINLHKIWQDNFCNSIFVPTVEYICPVDCVCCAVFYMVCAVFRRAKDEEEAGQNWHCGAEKGWQVANDDADNVWQGARCAVLRFISAVVGLAAPVCVVNMIKWKLIINSPNVHVQPIHAYVIELDELELDVNVNIDVARWMSKFIDKFIQTANRTRQRKQKESRSDISSQNPKSKSLGKFDVRAISYEVG